MEYEDYVKKKFKAAFKAGIGFLLMGISLIVILYGHQSLVYQILAIILVISGLVIFIIGIYEREINRSPEEREARRIKREEKKKMEKIKKFAKVKGEGFQEGIKEAKRKEEIRNYYTKNPPQSGI